MRDKSSILIYMVWSWDSGYTHKSGSLVWKDRLYKLSIRPACWVAPLGLASQHAFGVYDIISKPSYNYMQILKLTKLNHAMNTFCPLHIYYRQSALPNHLKIVDRLNFLYGFILDSSIRNFTTQFCPTSFWKFPCNMTEF